MTNTTTQQSTMHILSGKYQNNDTVMLINHIQCTFIYLVGAVVLHVDR